VTPVLKWRRAVDQLATSEPVSGLGLRRGLGVVGSMSGSGTTAAMRTIGGWNQHPEGHLDERWPGGPAKPVVSGCGFDLARRRE